MVPGPTGGDSVALRAGGGRPARLSVPEFRFCLLEAWTMSLIEFAKILVMDIDLLV